MIESLHVILQSVNHLARFEIRLKRTCDSSLVSDTWTGSCLTVPPAWFFRPRSLVRPARPRAFFISHRPPTYLDFIQYPATLNTRSILNNSRAPYNPFEHILEQTDLHYAFQVQGRAPLREAQGRSRTHSSEVCRPHSSKNISLLL